MVAAKYAIELEREAAERQLSGLKNVGSSSQNCDNEDFGRSSEKAAEKFNESPRTIQSAVKVIKEGAIKLV